MGFIDFLNRYLLCVCYVGGFVLEIGDKGI